jgi:hypothetical protein
MSNGRRSQSAEILATSAAHARRSGEEENGAMRIAGDDSAEMAAQTLNSVANGALE